MLTIRNGYCVPDLPSVYKQQRIMAKLEKEKLSELDRRKTLKIDQKEEEEDIQDLLEDNVDIFGEGDDTVSTVSQGPKTTIQPDAILLTPGKENGLKNVNGYKN